MNKICKKYILAPTVSSKVNTKTHQGLELQEIFVAFLVFCVKIFIVSAYSPA